MPPVTCKIPRDSYTGPKDTDKHWNHEDDQYDVELKGYKPDAEVTLVCDNDYSFEDESFEKVLKCTSKGDWDVWVGNKTAGPWESSHRCVHKTHCLYPDNVEKAGEDDDEEPAASHKLPYEEKINLKCGSGLDMFINQSGTYRKADQSIGEPIEVTCVIDQDRPNSVIGRLSPAIHCGKKIHLMTHLGAGLEYVPQHGSAMLDKQVIKNETIYKNFETTVRQIEGFSNSNVTFLDEKKFRYISKEETLLQTNFLVFPAQLTETRGLDELMTDVDNEIKKLTNVKIRLDGLEININRAERIPKDTCGGFTEMNSKGTYRWNTSSDLTQQQKCNFSDSTNAKEDATAKCVCDEDLCVLDTQDTYTDCPFKNEKTNDLDKLNKKNITKSEKAEELKKMTEDLEEDDIDEDGYDIGANTISDILDTEDTESLGSKANEDVLDVIDKFASAGSVVAYKEAAATEKYLKALDKVLLNTEVPEDDSKPIIKSNMRMALKSLPKNIKKDLTVSCSDSTGEESVKISDGGSDNVDSDEEIVMKIPTSITKSLKENNKFYFVVFEKDTFFTTEELFTGKKVLQSKVFSAGVAGIPDIKRIDPPITFKMRTLNRSAENKSECVYWRDTGGGVRDRAIVNVTTLSSTREMTVCQTDHLTSFAILMSSSPLPEIHEKIQTVITYLGCSLSIIGLILSLVGLSVFRVIRKPVATKVHINMSAALLLANVTFLIGIDEVGSPMACLACGLLCHYFFLAAVLWMGVEGFHLYVMIVRVFGHLSNRFLLKCAVFAWGFPLLMVAVTLGWSVDNYETVKFCWLKPTPMIAFFMAPVMIVILINTYMFIRVTQEITKSQNRKTDNLPSNQHAGLSDIREKLVKVRASVSVMVLLGLTWILGPIMLLDVVPALRLPVTYLFTVCNSLQGFLFFFFHCAIKTDVKERWKTYLGLEMSHSQISDLSKTYNQKNSKPLTHQKTTEFSKLGDSAASLNKSLLSFKPKNKVKPGSGRPGSPEDDSELAIVDF